MITARVQLLGGASFVDAENRAYPLERKTALLLAYLAVEGPTPRARLAALLWPDAIDRRARANLRQSLSRLHRLAGGPLVEPGDAARLRDDVDVDARAVLRLRFSPDDAGLALEAGEFLAGLECDETGDLDDWLVATRLTLQRIRSRAREAEAVRLEEAGEFGPASIWTERVLELEPLSEEAHRRLMRLHYLLGDRAAALRAYRRCREVLLAELAIEPAPETRQLAEWIERRTVASPEPQPRANRLPLTVLRPPRLIGRQREWAALEEAWERNQLIFLVGPAGVGKTRLALDFVGSKGGCIYIESRPGDRAVPFASQARALRRMLAERPDLQLPEWIQREIARLLPELGEQPPPVDLDQNALLRFYQAQVDLVRLALPQGGVLLIDNLHFCDPASAAIGDYMMAEIQGAAIEGGQIHSVFCTRGGDSPEIDEAIGRIVLSGIATRIDLEPLTAADVAELLAELQVPGVGEHANRLATHTGGNPLFLLETIKHLIESSALEQGFPERLIPRGVVGTLLRERIEKLSPLARRIAEVAAIAGDRFDLEVAAQVLETPSLELADAWRELEAAQVMKGRRFTHDLHHEAVLARISGVVEEQLRERVAVAFPAPPGKPAGTRVTLRRSSTT